MHQPRIALDHFPLASQLIKRHSAVFDGRDHGWHLIKIAAKLFEGRADFALRQRRDRALLDDLTLSILRCRAGSQSERSGVLFVLAHEQILNLSSAPESQQKQTGRDWVERSAMPDFLDFKFPSDQGD